MSIPATIVDKLRNYEYEKRGCGDAVGDIYALIHHIAILEEEIDDLRAEAREIDGGDASRGAASGTVALDVNGYPWLCDEGGWWRLVKDVVQGKRDELHPLLGPYTIVYAPGEKS